MTQNRFSGPKGEAKSNKVLGKTTVTSARKVPDRDSGRCASASLPFVANRLLESNDPDDNALGRNLRDEVGLKSLHAVRRFRSRRPKRCRAAPSLTARSMPNPGPALAPHLS